MMCYDGHVIHRCCLCRHYSCEMYLSHDPHICEKLDCDHKPTCYACLQNILGPAAEYADENRN